MNFKKALTVCLLLVSLTGCSSLFKKKLSPSNEELIQKLKGVSLLKPKVTGRLLFRADFEGRKGIAPALIALDFKKQDAPKMRIEVVDLIGQTQVMLLINEKSELLWIDARKMKIKIFQKEWNGIPVQSLPYIFLGAFPDLVFKGTFGALTENTDCLLKYSSKNLTSTVETECATTGVLKKWTGSFLQTQPTPFTLEYSDSQAHRDDLFPKKGSLTAPALKVDWNWRERTWEEELSDQLFEWNTSLHPDYELQYIDHL